MKNSKKFIGLVFGLCFGIVLFVGGVNYIIDPYGFNNKVVINKINSKKLSNTNFTTIFKSNILSKDKFDTILLGTSRIGVMNPEVVDKYLGAKSFNLEYPGSVTDIHKKLFLYAVNKNKIKNLIYGIDFMSFNKNRTHSDFKEFYENEEDIVSFNQINMNKMIFNLDIFIKSYTLVVKNLLGLQKTEVVYRKNGMRDYINHIEYLQNGTFNLDDEINKSIDSYFKVGGVYKNYHFSEKYLNDFKFIVNYCRENNINLFVYIPPMYSKHFDKLADAGLFDEFENFKKQIVEITDFIDFTGHNTISNNKNNYWDSSHLRVELSEVIFARIFNDKSINVPEDFGVLVTKENIDSHLQTLRKQIREYNRSEKEH